MAKTADSSWYPPEGPKPPTEQKPAPGTPVNGPGFGTVNQTAQANPDMTANIDRQKAWSEGLAGNTTQILGKALGDTMDQFRGGRLQQQELMNASRGMAGSSWANQAADTTQSAAANKASDIAFQSAQAREKMLGDSFSQAGSLLGQRENALQGQQGLGLQAAGLAANEKLGQAGLNLQQKQHEAAVQQQNFQNQLAAAAQQQQQYLALMQLSRTSPTYEVQAANMPGTSTPGTSPGGSPGMGPALAPNNPVPVYGAQPLFGASSSNRRSGLS